MADIEVLAPGGNQDSVQDELCEEMFCVCLGDLVER